MLTFQSKAILPRFLEHSAECQGADLALIEADRCISYGELQGGTYKVATYLADLGVGRGSRVLMMMTNSIEFVIAFWAIQYLGAVAVPISPDTKAAKMNWIVSDCTPVVMIVDGVLSSRIGEFRASGAHSTEILWNGGPDNPDIFTIAHIVNSNVTAAAGSIRSAAIDQDLACIIYTSGSTGTPKGVMLSHLNMVTASSSVAEYLALTSGDRVFCAMPFSFDYGLHQILMTTLIGATLIVEKNFSQPLFSLHRMVRQFTTVFPIVPTMVSLIAPLAGRFDFSKVKTITSTAAALYPDAIECLSQVFTEARIFSMYGLTECHRCTYLEPTELGQRKDSVGKAIPNTELWVIDKFGKRHNHSATGELVIRGSTVMKGYWNNGMKTDEVLRPGPFPGERVFHTGDICRIDAEGYVYFVCRRDDILKVKGEKVAPKELECTLMKHPDIVEAAIIGMPHIALGHEVIAFVVIREGATPDVPGMRAWCAQYLEGFMVPSRIEVIESLPKNTNGKIDKLALKERINGHKESAISLPASSREFPTGSKR